MLIVAFAALGSVLNCHKTVQCDKCDMWVHNDCSFLSDSPGGGGGGIYHAFEKGDPFIYLIVQNFDLNTIIYKYIDFLSCVCQQKSSLEHGCSENLVIHRLNMEKWGHSYILT